MVCQKHWSLSYFGLLRWGFGLFGIVKLVRGLM
jgi:hypothetical protein